MQNPLVSAIIPTYNRAGSIGQAVGSILNQTYENLEVIVVDDGSTDNTQEILKAFGDKIRVIVQENSGPSAARNNGAKEAKGEILAFLDSDDLWLPEKIAKQVAVMTRQTEYAPCCLTNIQFDDPERDNKSSFDIADLHPQVSEDLWLNVAEVLASRFVLFSQGLAVYKEDYFKVGGFDESLRFMEDYELAMRLALLGPWTYISEPLAVWCGNEGNNLSKEAMEDQIKFHKGNAEIFEKLLSDIPKSKTAVRSLLQRRLKSTYCQINYLSKQNIVNRIILILDKLRNKMFRKSASYPRMITK